MSYDLNNHEDLIVDKIISIVTDIVPSLNLLLKENPNDVDSNELTRYLDQHTDVKATELLDVLIDTELDDTLLIHTTRTNYSTVKVYGLGGLKTTTQHKAYIIVFSELDSSEKPLRCGVVCEWNLATAVKANFVNSTEESINNANFILCELLQTASELNTGMESGT